jgi:thymidylate kinase
MTTRIHLSATERDGVPVPSEQIEPQEAERKGGDPHTMEQQPALELIRSLCAELDVRRIAYCHWKSNDRLDRSATGDNDLDLLVSRADTQRFTSILAKLGFREAQGPVTWQIPGILDYYGYDQPSERLVHVHVHYQLVVGHDATKNYHLPIERPYLESAVQGDLFRVPAPEFELIVFVIRMVLKHSTWDTILVRQGALSTAERRELAYLQAKASLPHAYAVLRQHLACVDAPLFENCIRSLQPECPSWFRARIGQQLQNRLRAYARRSQAADVCLKLWRRVAWPIRWRLFRHWPKKRLVSGGAILAIVGGDGSGKSTAVEELYAWLSAHFDVTKIHMGKPDWSWLTVAVRAVLRIGRSLGLYPFMRSSIEYTSDTESVVFPGYPWLLRSVCTARDRNLTYARARRFASNRGLVISDRFPLPQVKFMDGPYQSGRVVRAGKADWLIEALTRLEARYYESILLPEVLIVLRVDPEIAVERKADEDAVSVRARSTEIQELDWRQTPAHIIDANRSRAEVLARLKAIVWSNL